MKKVIKIALSLGIAVLLCVVAIHQYTNFVQQSYVDKLEYMFNKERLFLWERLDNFESVEYDSKHGISSVDTKDTWIMVKTDLGSQTISGLEWEPISVTYYVSEELTLKIRCNNEMEKTVIVIDKGTGQAQWYYIREKDGTVIEGIELKEITGLTTEELVGLAEEKINEINNLLDIFFQEEVKRRLMLLVIELGAIGIITILLIIDIIRERTTIVEN